MKIKLPVAIKTYRVKSNRTHPDIGGPLCWYMIVLYSDGQLDCNCQASQMGRLCRHKIKVYNFIKEHEPNRKLRRIKAIEDGKV